MKEEYSKADILVPPTAAGMVYTLIPITELCLVLERSSALVDSGPGNNQQAPTFLYLRETLLVDML